jgi:hypothetical protein
VLQNLDVSNVQVKLVELEGIGNRLSALEQTVIRGPR